ncbi:MAG: TetR family transcriptional regulator [Caldithrix sp.]|nr:TetR family transcriptional regulator [Caldithrix sp.]
MFARHGKEATKLSDVARHSGVNTSLIYHHFRSKEKLYGIVLRSQLKKMVDYLHDHLLYNSMIEKNSQKVIAVFFEFRQNHSSILKMLLHEINSGAEMLVAILHGDYLKEYQQKIKNIISILEKYVFGGCKSDEECMQHFINLVGILMIFFLLEPLFKRLFFIDEHSREQFIKKRIKPVSQMYHYTEKAMG